MRHSFLAFLLLMVGVGCATAEKSPLARFARLAKKPAAAKASPVPATELEGFFARLGAEKAEGTVRKDDIPFDYYSSPAALPFIGATKSTDVELHRAVAMALPRAADDQRFAAAASLAELGPSDPEILRAVADVFEQALLDRGFDREPARLKYARDLLAVLARRPEPDERIEGLVLEVFDDATPAELRRDASSLMAGWRVLTPETQQSLLARARAPSTAQRTRIEFFGYLKNLEGPGDELVLNALEIFQQDEDSYAREEALALLVTWRPTSQGVVARLSEAGIETSAGGREPAAVKGN